MRSIVFLFFIFSFLQVNIFSQHIVKGKVTDEHSGEPLADVNIQIPSLGTGAYSNEDGIFEISSIPQGEYQLRITLVGYETIEELISVPVNDILSFEMEEEAEELEDVTVSSTRTSRTIRDIPTRIEVIAAEELDEKISMEPSNISMLLNESSGIYVQPTSATSGNATISIQGLEGRYTQILKDGFPLYGGYSGSLSIMQIPPINLKQVEVIKGSASTLYGADAIAGMINLITKDPNDKPETSLLYNMTSAGGIDISGFYSGRNENLGITVFAGRNTQKRYDANDDNFSDLPDIERYTAEPELYYYFGDNSQASLGISYLTEERTGGDIFAIDSGGDSLRNYIEENKSERITSRFNFTMGLNNNSRINFKNSFSYFDRSLSLPTTGFEGENVSSYSEINYLTALDEHSVVFGLNLQTENFNEKADITNRDYHYYTFGGFIQDIWKISDQFGIEAGLRGDYNSKHGTFVLPRVSAIYNISTSVSLRIGGGLGYKIPTIFLERSERAAYLNVLPLKEDINAERSAGINFDINYKSLLFDEIVFSINQAFYYTHITSPVVANTDSLIRNIIYYENSDGNISTGGFETNIKFSYDHFKLYTFYTYINAKEDLGNLTREPELTPRHKFGATLFFEEHDNFRIGLEAYFTGRQRLSDETHTRSFWITGLMLEKHLDIFAIFLNFENFIDTRQSKYGNIVTGSRSNPQFVEIWAPLEGFVINGGVKIRL